MTVFLRTGNAYRPADELDLDLHEKLPAANYIIKINPMTEQLYFDTVDSFSLPPKLYGKTESHAGRILATFADRSASTGVLLSGEKGSGKSLLAKVLTVKGAELGYPTIIVNSPMTGDKFNQLIQDIEQPAIVFFDEFEKVYNNEQQEELLTLLDGTFPSKKLFVLTCNDPWRVDAHMRNRPGRIFYALDFKGLSQEFIREYCDDNLDNKGQIEQVVNVTQLFDQFNFDMLKALVEEMNRYNETAYDALEMLNTKPEGENGGKYDVKLTMQGKDITLRDNTWDGNPMNVRRGNINLYFYCPEDDDSCEGEAVFYATDLKRIEPADGRLVYVNNEGAVATFIRRRDAKYDFRDALGAF